MVSTRQSSSSRRRKLAPAIVAEIEALTAAGRSLSMVAAALSLAKGTVAPYARLARERLNIPTAKGGPSYGPERAALTPEMIREVERRTVLRHRAAVIARELSMPGWLVYLLQKELRDRVPVALARPRRDGSTPLEIVRLVEQRVAAGESARQVALSLGLNVGTAQNIVRLWRTRTGAVSPHASSSNKAGPAAVTPEALALARFGVGAKQIRAQLGVSARVAHAAQATIRDEGFACACGRPLGHPGGCTANARLKSDYIGDDKRELVLQWTIQGLGVAAIADRLDISRTTAFLLRRPFADGLRARGVLCPCGQLIAHAGACAAKGRTAPDPALLERIRTKLLKGDSVATVAGFLGAGADVVRQQLRKIERNEVDQKKRRAGASKQRQTTRSSDALAANGDALFGEIARHVPSKIDAGLRDDIIGEMYLAVSSGEVARDDVGIVAKRFISRAFNTWADSFRSRSMDAPLGPDDDRTLGDTFDDSTSLYIIEEIDLF